MYWGIYEVHVFPYLRACDTEEYGLQSKEPDMLHVSAQLLMLSFFHERIWWNTNKHSTYPLYFVHSDTVLSKAGWDSQFYFRPL